MRWARGGRCVISVQGTEAVRQNAGNLGTDFDEEMLEELQTELSSASPNDEVYANLHNSAARRVRLATLEHRKTEWMSALSTLESFFVVVCCRRFTLFQSRDYAEAIPPVLLVMFLWMTARGLIPLGGFAYTRIDGSKRVNKVKSRKDDQYRWGTVHQTLKAVYSWSEYYGVIAPQVCRARAGKGARASPRVLNR